MADSTVRERCGCGAEYEASGKYATDKDLEGWRLRHRKDCIIILTIANIKEDRAANKHV